MMRSQAAGHKHPDLILLIHSMDIFREPALIPAVKPAQKRNDHLAAVVVSTDHQIHVPDLARISEDEAVRAVGQHDLLAVRVLKLLQEGKGIRRRRRCVVIAI